MPAGKAPSLGLGCGQQAKDHCRDWSCTNRLEVLSGFLSFFFLVVLVDLGPQSGFLGGASRFRVVPPGFNMVGGLG